MDTSSSVAFSAGERFGDVEVVGPDALVGVEDVEFDEDADRGVRIVRSDAIELPLPPLRSRCVTFRMAAASSETDSSSSDIVETAVNLVRPLAERSGIAIGVGRLSSSCFSLRAKRLSNEKHCQFSWDGAPNHLYAGDRLLRKIKTERMV